MSRIIELLNETIPIDSVTGNEQAISEYYLDYLKKLGLDVERDSNNNVIAMIGNGDGKTILFNGHIDTVHPHPDLEFKIEGDIAYGRGTADMKGQIASMIDSASRLTNEEIKGRIVYTFVVCEESGKKEIREQGSHYVIENLLGRGIAPDLVIIGESSQINDDGYSFCNGERGRCVVSYEITGEAGHGAFGLEGGINVAALAGNAVYHLARNDRWVGKKNNINPVLNFEHRYMPNEIPGKATIHIDIRYEREEDLQWILNRIDKIVQDSLHEDGFIGNGKLEKEEPEITGKPVKTENSKISGLISQAYVDITGNEPEQILSGFGTDGRMIRKLLADTPIYIVGAGNQKLAHSSREFITISQLETYSQIYDKIALTFLRQV